MLLISSITPLQSQVGTVDYVPNGGFEGISVDETRLGVYEYRYGKYSLWWRQFHKWTVPNEMGTLPTWPIWNDRRWDRFDPMYAPVTCSSSDLFSVHLPDCENGYAPSAWDIPRNRFGFQPIRPGSFGQKYAGLYYRLNGIRLDGAGIQEPFEGNAATDFWREYLEVELLCALEANALYTLSFWVSLAEVSDRSIRLEARVSPQPYHTHPLDNCDVIKDNDELPAHVRIPVTDGVAGVSVFSPDILPKVGNAPNNGWTHVQGTITAVGGEKYLTIGNFDLNNGIPSNPIAFECLPYYANEPFSQKRVYFYVDDVRLTRVEACTCDVIVRIEPIIPSAGKCCYQLKLANGVGEFPCGSCTVDMLDVYTVSGTPPSEPVLTLVHSWNGATSHGPIAGDLIPVDIGQICLDEFSGYKEVVVKVKNSAGAVLCTTGTTAVGCVQPCNCSEFPESIDLTPVTVGNNPCCFRLKINASLLPETCQIASIRYYRLQYDNSRVEIVEARYDTPVSSTFSGYVHTFCPTSPIDDQDILIEFRNAQGEVICFNILRPKCQCDCRDRGVEVKLVQVTDPSGKCCFDVRVTNNVKCKVTLKKIIVSKLDGSMVTASPGWVGASVGANKEISSSSGVELPPGSSTIIGRICPGDCPITDPSFSQIWAEFADADESCNRVQVENATETACPFTIDCSKFNVSIVAYPIWNSQCCWYGVYASVDACPSAIRGLRVDVTKGGYHLNVPAPGPISTLMSGLYCEYGAGTYIVKLMRADGTVLCTKTVTTTSCYSANN